MRIEADNGPSTTCFRKSVKGSLVKCSIPGKGYRIRISTAEGLLDGSQKYIKCFLCLLLWIEYLSHSYTNDLEELKNLMRGIVSKAQLTGNIFPWPSFMLQSVAETLILLPIPVKLASSLLFLRSATIWFAFPKFLNLFRPPSAPRAVLGLFVNLGSEALTWNCCAEAITVDASSVKWPFWSNKSNATPGILKIDLGISGLFSTQSQKHRITGNRINSYYTPQCIYCKEDV